MNFITMCHVKKHTRQTYIWRGRKKTVFNLEDIQAYRLLTTTVIRHTSVQITYYNCYIFDYLLQLLYFRLLTTTVIFSITNYNCYMYIFDYLLQLLYFPLLTTTVIFLITHYNCYIFDNSLQLLCFRLPTTTVIFLFTYYNCYIFVFPQHVDQVLDSGLTQVIIRHVKLRHCLTQLQVNTNN